MNEIEVIDGVKGEWRTVTKPSEVKVGQRVRYKHKSYAFGCDIDKRCIGLSENGNIVTNTEDGKRADSSLFDGYWSNIQAFFPLPVRSKRKVAKVQADTFMDCDGWIVCKVDMVVNNQSISLGVYRSKKLAIRGARRFCKAIGYECEIVKEGK